MAVSFEMLTLTLLPLEEVLPGRTVSGVGNGYFVKLIYLLLVSLSTSQSIHRPLGEVYRRRFYSDVCYTLRHAN